MILVFGGTTEGRQVCGMLADMGHAFWYSTKTVVDAVLPPNGRYRHGAFTPEALEGFCRVEGVRLMIDAGHPFAEELHRTIGRVSGVTGIPVVRVERQYPPRVEHPLVRYVPGYAELLAELEEGEEVHGLPELRAGGMQPAEDAQDRQMSAVGDAPVLVLTGVQSIARLRSYWERRRMLFRILPRESSVVLARASGFPEADLLLAYPEADVGAEIGLIRRTRAWAVVTKESGESGFLSVKIAAAMAAGVPLFIICRPGLPEGFVPVEGQADLLREIKRYCS